MPQFLLVCLGSACLFAVPHVSVERVHLGDQAEQLLLQGSECGGVDKCAGPGNDLLGFGALGFRHVGQRILPDVGAGVGDVGLGKIAQAVQVLQAGEHLVTVEAGRPGPWLLFWHASQYRPGRGSGWAVVPRRSGSTPGTAPRTRR